MEGLRNCLLCKITILQFQNCFKLRGDCAIFRSARMNHASFFLEEGFGVSQVAGLANFRSRMSGFTIKLYGSSGFEMCHGL